MKVKIYGLGWVGKAMKTLFPDALVHDPALNLSAKEKADIAFVCVPTPNIGEGKLDTSIVEEVIENSTENLIVIRSTVNPGDCGQWTVKYKKNIVMQPEYLGETVNHPMTDQKNRPFIIIGGKPKDRRKLIELYQTVYNANINIRQVSCLEAEIIKFTENRAIAFKVAQCQELYDVCQLAGVDYYTIREAVYSDDPRFNLWWTFVFPDKRGANSKCIPKDVYAWCAWAESLGYEPKITRALLNKNKEWISQS
jgi:UDPglucose 6-dehydrogenase